MDEIVRSENFDQKLSADERARVNIIKSHIDTANIGSLITFGTEAQKQVSDFSDKLLSNVKAKSAGHAGTILSELLGKIRELHIDSLDGKGSGFLGKIPFLGSLIDSSKKFMDKYQSLSVQIVSIIESLEKARTELIRDVEILGQFYDKNIGYFREITIYIEAGEARLQELRETALPEMKQTAETSGDPTALHQYKDLAQFIERLDKKIHDLKLSRTVTFQAAPQIRLVQYSNQELAEKIQSSILNTIPLWKQQIVIAITLIRQKDVLGLQQDISDATNSLLEKNAELLKIGSTEIALEAEKGIVDIDTLKKVNAELISTLEETIQIQSQGRLKREKAADELKQLEKALKDRLLQISDNADYK
ncbi:toxic anion resistance protein [bacterium]|nr:toxic anion resistance protein [bacterium]